MEKDRNMILRQDSDRKPDPAYGRKRRGSYDFYLILATVLVLFAICLISIYGMFYFKFAQIHQMDGAVKSVYMNRMNSFMAPFIMGLLLLLGICVPKRLLPEAWLHRVTLLLLLGGGLAALTAGLRVSLYFILGASLLLQLIVLALALAGSRNLHFHRKGYWVRLGSSLMHLGLILFVFDLLLHERKNLHLFLFWITTGTTVAGMICSFYADIVVGLVRAKQRALAENKS